MLYLFPPACRCNAAGTSGPVDECHPMTGNCRCLSHVTGRDCSHCDVGFFNLQPGVGCERQMDSHRILKEDCMRDYALNLPLRYFPAFTRCKCNPVGSLSMACHPVTGECVCRPGVEGTLCGSCRVGFFRFSSQGCRGTLPTLHQALLLHSVPLSNCPIQFTLESFV